MPKSSGLLILLLIAVILFQPVENSRLTESHTVSPLTVCGDTAPQGDELDDTAKTVTVVIFVIIVILIIYCIADTDTNQTARR